MWVVVRGVDMIFSRAVSVAVPIPAKDPTWCVAFRSESSRVPLTGGVFVRIFCLFLGLPT